MAGTLKVELLLQAKDEATRQLQGIDRELEKIADDGKRAGRDMAQGFDSSTGALRNLENVLRAGVIVAALAAAKRAAFEAFGQIREMANELDRLAKGAPGVGLTAEELASLEFAAERSGIEVTQLSQALRFFNKQLSDAAAGNKTSAAAFDAMGVALRDSSGAVRGNIDVLKDAADVMSRFEDGANKSTLSARLFGEEAGGRMVPLLNAGSAGIEQLTDRFHELRSDLNPELIASAEAFNDSMTDLKTAMAGLRGVSAGELLKDLAFGVDLLATSVGNFNKTGGLRLGGFKSIMDAVSGAVGTAPKAIMQIATGPQEDTGDAEKRFKAQAEKRARELQSIVDQIQAATGGGGKSELEQAIEKAARAAESQAEAIRRANEQFRRAGLAATKEGLLALQSEDIAALPSPNKFFSAKDHLEAEKRIRAQYAESIKSLDDEMMDHLIANVREEAKATEQYLRAEHDAWLEYYAAAEERGQEFLREKNRQAAENAPKTFRQGFDQEIDFIRDSVSDFQSGANAANALASAIDGGVNSALRGMVDGSQSAGQAMRQFLQQMALDITATLIKIAALKLLLRGIGFLAGPAGAATSAAGSAFSGLVEGQLFTPGAGAGIAPPPVARGLSPAGAASSPNVTNININAMDAPSFKAFLAQNGADVITGIQNKNMRTRQDTRNAMRG